MKQTFRPFPPGTVQAGGEIRHRMELTAEKMLRHIDVEQLFVRHFRRRCAVPDLPGGFSGYGMFLDASKMSLPSPRTSMPSNPKSFAMEHISVQSIPGQASVENEIFT